MALHIPKNYKPSLNVRQTQLAVKTIRDLFQSSMEMELGLERVSAPLFVERSSGLNDNLNGTETPVNFCAKDIGDERLDIVHSLAKWKRMALGKYGFETGEGLYTNMNAIRKDEDLDNLHSMYVDQWDWERVISKQDRNVEYLQNQVRKIYKCFVHIAALLKRDFRSAVYDIPKEIHFFTCQELLDLYPNMNAKERENAICKKYGAVFLMQIGKTLSNNKKHDNRAPDYDDWELNGDILVWYEPLKCALELSSMGIRVDKSSLIKQLKLANAEDRKTLPYHKAILNDKLPLTIGGGIGQSRLCMLLLQKVHIGEVQASIWPESTQQKCKEAGISLL